MELAVKGADDVFHRSLVWLEKDDGVVGRLAGQGLKVDYRRLQAALGGDLPDFFRELQLAHAAIAIRRKALLADAAAKALADPSNPYTAFPGSRSPRVALHAEAPSRCSCIDGASDFRGQ